MRGPWNRPPGCACMNAGPLRDRCSKSWIRCNERLAYVQEQKRAEMEATLRAMGARLKSSPMKSKERTRK